MEKNMFQYTIKDVNGPLKLSKYIYDGTGYKMYVELEKDDEKVIHEQRIKLQPDEIKFIDDIVKKVDKYQHTKKGMASTVYYDPKYADDGNFISYALGMYSDGDDYFYMKDDDYCTEMADKMMKKVKEKHEEEVNEFVATLPKIIGNNHLSPKAVNNAFFEDYGGTEYDGFEDRKSTRLN